MSHDSRGLVLKFWRLFREFKNYDCNASYACEGHFYPEKVEIYYLNSKGVSLSKVYDDRAQLDTKTHLEIADSMEFSDLEPNTFATTSYIGIWLDRTAESANQHKISFSESIEIYEAGDTVLPNQTQTELTEEVKNMLFAYLNGFNEMAMEFVPKACEGCRNYHGVWYGKNRFICAIHPEGAQSEVCGDYESESNRELQ